jgi:hypothetical protein
MLVMASSENHAAFSNPSKLAIVVPGHGDLDILLVILYRRVNVPSVRSILYSTT